jgi:murein DD-endopeptidase MepM/ murein hydrolase activator NlpD
MEKKQSNMILFLRNNGFYLVLVLCLVAIGSAIVLLTVPNEPDTLRVEAPTAEPIGQVTKSNDQRLPDIQPILQKPKATATPKPLATAVPTAVPTAAPTPVPTAAPAAKTASTTQKAAAPVSGEIVFGYADDKLIYSVTLDQWTTLPAVDIAAKAGTEVKAVLSGTVQSVRQDDALGYLVEVKHSNGRTTIYACLGADVRVREGDKINAGTVLGTVGTSAISECALDPHLHFAFLIDGKPVDPKKYVRLG